jgi:hypothetical protein
LFYVLKNKCTLRFPERIYYNGKAATKKTLHVTRGTPLPYTLSLGNGAFVFEIHMDLSVWFNGKRCGISNTPFSKPVFFQTFCFKLFLVFVTIDGLLAFKSEN